MTVQQKGQSHQRLPTEIIINIFEHAVNRDAWQMYTLACVSKSIRSVFIRRLFHHLHLKSLEQLECLIAQGWPHLTNSKKDKLSLYLHFIHRMDDERDFYMDFVEYILSLPDDISKRITTLGIRTYPGNQQFTPLGIWSCNWIPNIKRLYVDSSLLPPFGQGSSAEEMLASMESGAPSSKPRAVPGLFIDFSNGPCSVETFAFVGSGMMGHFGHLEGLYGQRQYIQNTFVKIKRIYLFTSPWQQDGSEMHRQVDKVVEDFDAVTNVQLIVNIVIQGVEPRSWCPVEASVSALPNGTMWIQNVEIDQPQAPQE